MKHIPNVFTLLNLFFGCLAIVSTLQPGLTSVVDDNGSGFVGLPENIVMASAFIAIAAVIDFLDGFVARLLKASSDLGRQLDSLADVVSFGVAPGVIIFQFLRLSFAQQEGGLDVSTAWLMPAFIVPCAAAFRLGRFNLDTSTSTWFKGLPVPMVGMLVASFPLIYWFSLNETALSILGKTWFWYFIIALCSYLMISTIPMLSLKLKGLSMRTLMPVLIILIIGIAAALLTGWLAIPVVFAAYIIISLAFKPNNR